MSQEATEASPGPHLPTPTLGPKSGEHHTPGLGLDREGVASMLFLQADQHVVEVLIELQVGQQAGRRASGATKQPHSPQ